MQTGRFRSPGIKGRAYIYIYVSLYVPQILQRIGKGISFTISRERVESEVEPSTRTAMFAPLKHAPLLAKSVFSFDPLSLDKDFPNA